MDAPFTFTGKAIDYLLECEVIGIDSSVTLLVEITEDQGATWELFYQGLVNLPTKNDLLYPTQFKMQYNVKKVDLWSTFWNRKSTPVNVRSATDLDGNAVAVPAILNLAVPNQKIRQIYNANLSEDVGFDDLPAGQYIQFDLDNDVVKEINEKFSLPVSVNADLPVSLWDMQYAGDFTALGFRYTFSTGLSTAYAGLGVLLSHMDLFFRVTTAAGVKTDYPFIETDFSDRSEYTIDMPIAFLTKGDQITIYGLALTAFTVDLGNQLTIRGGLDGILSSYSQAYIEYNTTYPDTTADAILLYDVADAIIKRIAPTSLYSPLLGGAAQGYPDDGCDYPYILAPGLQFRGFSLADKPMAMSMDDFWAGANPVFNLGLGTEIIADVERIYIDNKKAFYDSSGYSILLNNVDHVSKTHKLDSVYKSFEIGASKWQLSGGGSAIDDPGPHKYASTFRLIGVAISIMTKWIIAPLLVELTRRAKLKPSETFDTDNDVFLIKIIPDLITPSPDLAGVATDLINPTSRYNKTLTPARMFYRWINVFNNGLTQYIGHPLTPSFKFISGLGNFLMGVTVAAACEESAAVIENADIPITSEALVGTDLIDFEWDLSWASYKLIRNSKRKMIGVATDASTYTYYFIQKIDFFLFKGKAKFTLIQAPNPFET